MGYKKTKGTEMMKQTVMAQIVVRVGVATWLLVASSAVAATTLESATTPTQSSAGDAASGALAPIELDLPEPMFVGTPRDIRSDNLEKPTGKARAPFMAPEGIVNLADGRPVDSSDPMPIIGELELITDGDKEAGEGFFVELGPMTQWVRIDLERPCEVFAVVVWHYHMQARVYRDVVVTLSDNPEAILDATDPDNILFNNDHDNSSGLGVGDDREYVETYEGRLIDAHGARGRYLHLYSRGSTGSDENHYIEVEVYGRPLEEKTATDEHG